MYCPGAKFDHEEHHHANGSEYTQNLDAEEVASIERLPMTPNELLPGTLVLLFRCWLDASLRLDVGDRCAAYLDFQTAKRISDFGVTPAEVLAR